jgi:hypothetical protein
MPNPEDFDSRDEFMDACMAETKREGLKKNQRLGKCLGMWRNHTGEDKE